MSQKMTMLFASLCVVATVFIIAGCEKKAEPQAPKSPTDQAESIAKETEPAVEETTGLQLCTHCGQIKGSDSCCKPDVEKCDKCGLAKGSPGCCKIPEGAEKCEICSHCGQIKGSDSCCQPGAEKCEKCGLAKGSPGCCMLPL